MGKYLFTGFIIVEAESKEEACKTAEGVYNSLQNDLGQTDVGAELDFGPFTEEECLDESELPHCDCDECQNCDGCDCEDDCDCDEDGECDGCECNCHSDNDDVKVPAKHLLN